MNATSEFDTDVRLAVYRAFVATGNAPSAADVATAVGAPAADVRAAFERLDAGRGIVLEPGTHDIWLANPFSATPTGFDVRTASRRYYAACGWDTLGIIPLLHGISNPSIGAPTLLRY